MAPLYPQWSDPPTDLSLSVNGIHLWCSHLNLAVGEIETLTKILSPDEQQRANRFYFERDRIHFIAGRGILRTLLGHYLNVAPDQLQFSYSARGKPALSPLPFAQQLQFNVSHSHGLALYAISRSLPVGIDLEYIRPLRDAEQLAKRFFSIGEYEVIRTLPDSQKQEVFFQGWTGKEAYLKATGDGLAGLADVELSLTPSHPPLLCRIAGDEDAASAWSLHSFRPAPDYIAALAVAENRPDLEYFRWQFGLK